MNTRDLFNSILLLLADPDLTFIKFRSSSGYSASNHIVKKAEGEVWRKTYCNVVIPDGTDSCKVVKPKRWICRKCIDSIMTPPQETLDRLAGYIRKGKEIESLTRKE